MGFNRVFFAFFFAVSFLGFAFGGEINEKTFKKLSNWAVRFFDPRYYNMQYLAKNASRGFSSISIDITCEKAKGFYYLLIREGPYVRRVDRRYRVASAKFFGENVCGKGIFYRLTAGLSAKEIYTDPVTGKRCGDYFYRICLYRKSGSKVIGKRCVKYKKVISYCDK